MEDDSLAMLLTPAGNLSLPPYLMEMLLPGGALMRPRSDRRSGKRRRAKLLTARRSDGPLASQTEEKERGRSIGSRIRNSERKANEEGIDTYMAWRAAPGGRG